MKKRQEFINFNRENLKGRKFLSINNSKLSIKKRADSIYSNEINLKRWFLLLTVILFAFISIFLLPTISATFSLGKPNYSIEKLYGPSQDIIGWMNVSLTNEPLGALFTSTVGSETNSINLSEMLKNNPDYNYSCSPVGCGNDYAAGSGSSSIQKSMIANGNITYGLKIVGDGFNSITGFSFDFSSNAPASEFPQLNIDILDDGVSDWIPTIASGTFAGNKNYGCYSIPVDGSGAINLYQYRNLVRLSPTPNLKIGAVITAISGGVANFSMEIQELSSGRIGGCNINDIDSGREISCIPTLSGKNFSVAKQGDFLVSIWSNQASQNKYGISYKVNQTCRGSNSENFQLFVQPGEYDSLNTLGTTRINSTEIAQSTGVQGIESKITNYIISKYQGNCGSEGCIVPLEFFSKGAQEINISNVQLFYKRGAVTEFSFEFYNVETTPARVNSGFKKLYFDQAGFTVPSSLKNYTFSLNFDNEQVFSEKIQVMDIPIIQSVTPEQTAAAVPTEFTAKVNVGKNATKFSWNFGDGSVTVITTGNAGNKTTHTYSQIGEYNLQVTVTDSRGLSSSKTLLVNVTSPRDFISLNLAQLKSSLSDIKSDISTFDAFSKKAINFSLELPPTEASVAGLEKRYNDATTEAQYNGIVADLLKIGVLPASVSKTKGAVGLPLILTAEHFNLDALESIAGAVSSGNEENYGNAAAFWAIDNLDMTVDFNEFSGRYGSKLESITKTFKISVDEKRDIPYDYFLIIPKLDGFYSDSAYRTDNESGYIYVNLRNQGTFTFSTTEDVGFTDLPAFISPATSRLTLIETTPPEEKKTSKWLIFGLVLFALLVLGIIVYVVLQEWYKRKYENHLFPNRNDLYNMAHYIHNALRKGMKNSGIEDKLKGAGWSNERIRYAMRKYAGKRTGMLEIPITRAVKKIEGR